VLFFTRCISDKLACINPFALTFLPPMIWQPLLIAFFTQFVPLGLARSLLTQYADRDFSWISLRPTVFNRRRCSNKNHPSPVPIHFARHHFQRCQRQMLPHRLALCPAANTHPLIAHRTNEQFTCNANTNGQHRPGQQNQLAPSTVHSATEEYSKPRE